MSQLSFDGDAHKVSKYVKRFEKLAGTENCPMELKGDMMLVERLPKVELKTSSGIILPHDMKTYKDTASDRTTDFGIVLMTGPGHVWEDGSNAAMTCKPGDVILLPGNVIWYSAFGTMADYEAYRIGLVRDAQVMLHFNNYVRAFEVLNEKD